MPRSKPCYIIRNIIIGTSVTFLSFTYGKWEYLSWRQGSEFHAAIRAKVNEDKIGILSDEPEFMKVIEYSNDRAEVLMNEGKGGQQVMLYFSRGENNEWLLDGAIWVTVANGCPKIIFPWYGASVNCY